jgi:hypothetical protein
MCKKMIIILFFASLFACANKTEGIPENAKNIVPPDVFMEMLYDVHLTDAIVLSKIIKFEDERADSLIYLALFEKYQYSREDFENTISYYVHYNLDSLNLMYSNIMDQFNYEKGQIIKK